MDETKKVEPEVAEDFTALEGPLNMALKIIAQKQGRDWTHTLHVTKDIGVGEFHAGQRICRMNPLTITQEPDLSKLIQKIFTTVDTLTEIREAKTKQGILEAQEIVRERARYLKRKMNGTFEAFRESLGEDQ